MPLSLQSKMMRVLQDQSFQRVGGNETIRTNVRIITATHHDLKAAAEAGQFRSDLYYRLNVFEIDLPPLRARLDDLPLLVKYFLRHARLELDKAVSSVSQEALDLLLAYQWPGNIRELQSVIKQAVLKSVGPVLVPDFLPDLASESISVATSTTTLESDEFSDSNAVLTPGNSDPDSERLRPTSPVAAWVDWDNFIATELEAGSRSMYDDAISLTEKHVISRVLNHTGGNQVQAAEMLGITRTTLRNKIKQHGIIIGRTVE